MYLRASNEIKFLFQIQAAGDAPWIAVYRIHCAISELAMNEWRLASRRTIIAHEAAGGVPVAVDPPDAIPIPDRRVVHAFFYERYEARLQQVLEFFDDDDEGRAYEEAYVRVV
jgi:hypothetical protein